MSIYGPNNNTPLVVGDLEEYAKQVYVDDQDEASINEHNIDKRHKPIISIATGHTGALTAGTFQWSFGDGGQGSNFGNCGYAMPSAGRILRMSLAVTGTIGGGGGGYHCGDCSVNCKWNGYIGLYRYKSIIRVFWY